MGCFCRHGQSDNRPRPETDTAPELERPAVEFRQRFGKRQTQAGTVFAGSKRIFRLHERFEDARQIVPGYTDTGVDDRRGLP